MTWKLINELDEDSLRRLLDELPAWVKFEEFERVAFVNQILVGMWAYLDATICSAIKEFVEPSIQENLPFPVSGFEFEKLALGDAPFQIRGVKHASLFDGPGQPMSLSVEVDAAWVTKPDIVAKLMPSKRWRMSHLDIRPAMYLRVDHLAVTGRLRLVFPLQQTLPIFNGMSICFLQRPEIDMSLKMLGGVDIMSAPALQEWFTALICSHISRAMTYPASVDLSFTEGPVEEQAREHHWPRGLATLQLQTVYMSRGQTQACMPSMVLQPATWVDPAFACDVHAMTYPLVMDPRRPESMEPWQASFPVFDPAQVLSVILVENISGDKGYPITIVPISLSPLFGDHHRSSAAGAPPQPGAPHTRADPVRAVPHAAAKHGVMPKSKSGSMLPNMLPPMLSVPSSLSSGSEGSRPVVHAADLERLLRPSGSRTDAGIPAAAGGAGDDGPSGRPPRPRREDSSSGRSRKQRGGLAGHNSRASLDSSLTIQAQSSLTVRPASLRDLTVNEHPSAAPAAPPMSETGSDASSVWAGMSGTAGPAASGTPPSTAGKTDAPRRRKNVLRRIFGRNASRQELRAEPSRATASSGAELASGQLSEEASTVQLQLQGPARLPGTARLPGELRCGVCNKVLSEAEQPPELRPPGAARPEPPAWLQQGVSEHPPVCRRCSRLSFAAQTSIAKSRTYSPRAHEPNDDDDDRWGPWAMQDASLHQQGAAPAAPLPSPLFHSCNSPAQSPRPHTTGHAPDQSPGLRHRRGHVQPHRAAAIVPYAAPARETGAPQPPRRQRPPPLQDPAQADALAFDELWGGRASAWDIAALRQGLVTQYAPVSPAAVERPGGSPVHVSASQDRMSDMGWSAGGAAAESEDRDELPRAIPFPRASSGPAAPAPAGPPLLARAAQQHCEVPLWLPDADGTVAAMGPGGAYIMMRPLRQKAWYRQLSLRWQTDILQQLPQATIAEMKRCAAAILSFEASQGFCGTHPLIRSYNRHVLGESRTRRVSSSRSVTQGSSISQPGGSQHKRTRMARAVSGTVGGMLHTLRSIAMTPMVASPQRRPTVSSHLPDDVQADQVMGDLDGDHPGRVSSADVQLEASASLSVQRGGGIFRGFAGCIKADLQWLPLQWTYLARGVPAPPLSRTRRNGVCMATGVLMIRLQRTIVYGTKMYRPQVVLQLDHVGARRELRRSGVRERWARQKTSLRHGSVDWDLSFSFCVEVEEDEHGRPLADDRFLQVEVMEVAQSLKARMRGVLAPGPDGARGGFERGGHREEAVDVSEATFVAAARVPLAKLLTRPNVAGQGVWQLLSHSVLIGRDDSADVASLGTVAIEAAWLPACQPAANA